MKKINLTIKTLIASCLFVIGLLVSPLSIHAEEAGTYARPSYTTTETYSIYHSTSGSIKLNITWLYLNDNNVIGMFHQSSSCSHNSGGTCRITTVQESGASTNQTNEIYYVTIKMSGIYGGNTYNISHRIKIQYNEFKDRTTFQS